MIGGKVLQDRHSPDGVRDATVEDLCRVDGINRHLAEQIYNALR
jgi:excinuclease UvrABC nuclease subunit